MERDIPAKPDKRSEEALYQRWYVGWQNENKNKPLVMMLDMIKEMQIQTGGNLLHL